MRSMEQNSAAIQEKLVEQYCQQGCPPNSLHHTTSLPLNSAAKGINSQCMLLITCSRRCCFCSISGTSIAFRDDLTAGDPSKNMAQKMEIVKMEFKHCCLCRPGMKADFSIFQHNLLETLTGDLSAIPEVTATFVDGQCSFGCSAFPLAPSMTPPATPSMASSATPSTAASAQSSQQN